MKKYLFLTLTLSVAALMVQAQKIKLGVKVGANMNKVTGVSFKDEYDLGYHAGGFLELGLSKKFSVQPEVLFNQVNTKRTTGFNQIYNQDNMNPSDIKLSYLSIPVLLRYDIGSLLSVNLGPQFSILIDDKQNLFDNGRDAFKKGDLAAVAGVSLNLSAIRVYGRYNIGLNNLNDIDNKDKWKSQQIQVGLGLAL